MEAKVNLFIIKYIKYQDNNIFIWHRNSSKPVQILKGHAQTVFINFYIVYFLQVNAVYWHPNNSSILVSGIFIINNLS